MLALELGPELDDRSSRDERADEQRVDERAEPLGARLRRDHRLRDREHGSDRAGDARERGRREHDRRRNRVGPPPDDREVEAEQQRRRQPDRAPAATAGTARPADGRRAAWSPARAARPARADKARSVARSWKWPSSHRLNQSPQPRNANPIASTPIVMKRRVAICRNRVSACTVVRCSSAIAAVVVEHLLDLGATRWTSRQAPGREREERRDRLRARRTRRATRRCRRRGPWSRRRSSGPEREAGDADRDVEGEHDRPGADRERVGEERALHRDRGEHAGAGEREHAEELPALERGTREHEGEHRDREQPPQDAAGGPSSRGRRSSRVAATPARS